MAKRLKYLVAGEWRDTESGVYYDITNSSTGEVMAEAPRCTADEVDAAVEAAAEAFPAWRDRPAPARGELVRRIADELRRHKEDLGRLVSLEAGKIADVLVVSGDPLENIQNLTNTRIVIHGGEMIRNDL